MSAKAKPQVAATVVVDSTSPSGVGEWLARKSGDAIEVTGELSGEIAGAFSAAGDAFSATRQVSSLVRKASVQQRMKARAAAHGITVTFE